MSPWCLCWPSPPHLEKNRSKRLKWWNPGSANPSPHLISWRSFIFTDFSCWLGMKVAFVFLTSRWTQKGQVTNKTKETSTKKPSSLHLCFPVPCLGGMNFHGNSKGSYIYIYIYLYKFSILHRCMYIVCIYSYLHSNKLTCLEHGPWMQMYICISSWKTLDIKLPCLPLPEGSNLSDFTVTFPQNEHGTWKWGHPLETKKSSNFETISSLGLGFLWGKSPAHLGKLYVAHP